MDLHHTAYIFGTVLLVGISVVRSVRLTREGLRAKREKAALTQTPPPS